MKKCFSANCLLSLQPQREHKRRGVMRRSPFELSWKGCSLRSLMYNSQYYMLLPALRSRPGDAIVVKF